jgi:Flp pilus assembly pilin Flp
VEQPARTDHGATAVEYALLAALISAVIVASIGLFGAAVAPLFDIPWP